MIYSNEINKVCALCRNAETIENNENEMFCRLKKQSMSISAGNCKKFDYDIFKKVVHRKKRLKTNFSAEDFSLE